MNNDIKNRDFFIDLRKRNLKRAGKDFLSNIFLSKEKDDIRLSAEECLKICNTLGISIEEILMIANSHHLEIDHEGFFELLDEQDKKMKFIKAR